MLPEAHVRAIQTTRWQHSSPLVSASPMLAAAPLEAQLEVHMDSVLPRAHPEAAAFPGRKAAAGLRVAQGLPEQVR